MRKMMVQLHDRADNTWFSCNLDVHMDLKCR